MLARVAKSRHLPERFNWVSLFFIPKGNSQDGEERALGCYDPLAGLFLLDLWQHAELKFQRNWNFAYQAGMRREFAITIQNALCWRMAKAGLSSVGLFYDSRNAFWAPPAEEVRGAAQRVLHGLFCELFLQHLDGLTLVLSGDCKSDSEIHLHNTTGTPPGARFSAELFLELFNDCAERWWTNSCDARCSATFVWDPQLTIRDVSLTAFADDLARRFLVDAPSVAAAHRAIAKADLAFNNAFHPSGFQQNEKKRVCSPAFVGEGSGKATRAMASAAGRLRCKVEHATRYLGPFLNAHANNVDEHKLRLTACRRTFAMMRKIWRRLPRRMGLPLFRAIAISQLLDGQVCFEQSGQQLADYDSLIARQLRAVWRGKTTEKLDGEGGAIVYRRMSTQAVFAASKWAGAAVELQVLRLQFWQGVLAAQGDQHAQLLATVFGELAFEPQRQFAADGQLREDANPWARRLLDDVRSLRRVDDFAAFSESVGDNLFKLLQLGPLRDAFTVFDFRVLRLMEFRKSVPPPPGFHPNVVSSSPPSDDPSNDDDHDGFIDSQCQLCAASLPYVCCELLDSGEPCNKRFASQQRLVAHMVAAASGTHSATIAFTSLVVRNECIVCKAVYSTTKNAQQHLRRSVLRGSCLGSGCSFKATPDPYPTNAKCPLCQAPLSNFKNPRLHLALHLPPSLRQLTRTDDDDDDDDIDLDDVAPIPILLHRRSQQSLR